MASSPSEISVSDQCLKEYQKLKLRKKYKYIIYKLSENYKSIIVDKTQEHSTYDDFIDQLPAEAPRYAVYNFDCEKSGEDQRSRIVFLSWIPEKSKIKEKMLYASSSDVLLRELDGVYVKIQCTDLDDISYETVLKTCTS